MKPFGMNFGTTAQVSSFAGQTGWMTPLWDTEAKRLFVRDGTAQQTYAIAMQSDLSAYLTTAAAATTYLGINDKAASATTADSATSAASAASATTAGACTGNAATATKLQTARTISITGALQGSASFDGSDNVSISVAYQEVPASIPTGMIAFFHATTPPEGWLACNGQNVDRTVYAKLFSVIGTTYGSGDGSKTFTLPNLHHRFLEGTTTASEVGQSVSEGLPNITGETWYQHDIGLVSPVASPIGAFSKGSQYEHAVMGSGGSYSFALKLDASLSSLLFGQASTVQPPSLRFLPCIKT